LGLNLYIVLYIHSLFLLYKLYRSDLSEAGAAFISSRPARSAAHTASNAPSDLDLDDINECLFDVGSSNKRAHVMNQVTRMNIVESIPEVKQEHVCEEDAEHQHEQCRQQSGSFRRVVLDALNDVYQASYSGAFGEYRAMLLGGSGGEGWKDAKDAALKLLEDKSIENVELEIEKAMEDTRQALEDSSQKAAEFEHATNELSRLEELLRNASNAADNEKAAELERLRAAEKARLRALVRMCGVCGRGDNPYSGCGYGGNSPVPIFVTVGDMTSKFS
jgi:hypothetical protein